MKTYHIKDLLKKELLILELPRVCDYELDEEMIWVINLENGLTYRAEGSYTLLGKPDEIKEEDAKELVETDEISDVEDYRYQIVFIDYKDEENAFSTATESLLSAMESVIFWENPLDEPSDEIGCECEECQEGFEIKYNDFMIAQEKTFDKTRTLIFVKN